MRRDAFTLFEVAISLLIVSATVLAVILVLPIGIRVQSEARHELYAAAALMSLLDNAHHPAPVIGTDDHRNRVALEPGRPVASGLRDALVYSSAFAPDIEQHISMPDMGALPLPTAIARRLDSDGDEIARVLDAGGQLFYLHPNNVRGLHSPFTSKNSSLRISPPAEFHELVFAVVGEAQQNLLPAHPIAQRPHHEIYPFPPAWLRHRNSGRDSQRNGGRAHLAADGTVVQVTLGGAYPGTTPHGDGTWIGDHHHDRGRSYTLGGDPNRVEPGDPAWDLDQPRPLQLDHGRNWLSFARREPASTWNAGLNAYLALAGDFTGGWLPIQNLLSLGYPSFDNRGRPTVDQVPGGSIPMPTYEMRASYRDRAIDLWHAVKPVHPGLPALGPRYAPAGDDLRLDCDRYRYPPAALATFTGLEPDQLGAADFPPHPAQVLALSHLAHSAIVVAGLRPPFGDRRDLLWFDALSPGLDTDGDGLNDSYTDAVGGAWIKDAKRVRQVGPDQLELTSDAYTPCELYAGDYLWLPELPDLVFEAAADLSVPAGGSTGTLRLVAAYPVLGRDQGFRYGARQTPNLPPGLVGHATRVATARDLAFAAEVHEMCLRWAIRYARELPGDWGAPRPANRASSLDRPLAMWDLFPGGTALRPTDAGFATATERHYRVLGPFNPAATRYGAASQFPRGTSPVTAHATTHVPLDDRRASDLDAVTGNPVLATTTDAIDRQRFWPARAFDHRDRGREIVFWAAAWQDDLDAETAPGAAMDLAKLGWSVGDGSGARRISAPPASSSDYDLAHVDLFSTGHPEQRLAWLDAERSDWGYVPFRVDGRGRRKYAYDGRNTTDLDRMGIHWGADRNNNAILDRGSVDPAIRLRAREVARFTVYDPVLRVHARN